jgi:ankyrin repeat protein
MMDEKVGVQGGVVKGTIAKEENKQLAAENGETKDEARYARNKAAGELGNKRGILDDKVDDDRTGHAEEQVGEGEVKEPRKLSKTKMKKEKKLKRDAEFEEKSKTMKMTWPLHWAAVNNDLVFLKAALSDDNENAQSLNDLGKAPLHCAAEKGNRDAAELLLKGKADIEQTDNLGRTPLHCAANHATGSQKQRNVEMLRWLAQQGANCVEPRVCGGISKRAVRFIQELSPHVENSVCLNIMSREEKEKKRIERKEKSAKLKSTWPLHWAAYNNDLVMLETALLEGRASVDGLDDLGRTPLHCAAFHGDLDVSKLLMSYNASLEHTDQCGRTPLHLAADRKDTGVLQWLVQQGANVKAPITTHTSEQAVQRIRVVVQESSSTKIDLPGAQIDKLERDHEATNKATGEEKREKYKETITERKDEQRTKWPLHWAAANNDLAMVEDNLSDALTNVDQPDDFWRTPLHRAAASGHIEVAKVLLNCKADIEQKDNYGRTPLHLAAEEKESGKDIMEILRWFLQQGANANAPIIANHTTREAVQRIIEVMQESNSTKMDLLRIQLQELKKDHESTKEALTESESNVAVLASNLISTNRKLEEGSDALSAMQSQQMQSVATLTSAETARDKFHNDLLAAKKELKSAKMALQEAEMVKRKENISKARHYHVGVKEASSGITVKLEKQEGEHQQEVSTLAAAHAQELEAAKDKTTELEDGLACTVCLDQPKTVCLFPCSHVCLCESCAEGWSDPCPICRAVVTMQRKVFFA